MMVASYTKFVDSVDFLKYMHILYKLDFSREVEESDRYECTGLKQIEGLQ